MLPAPFKKICFLLCMLLAGSAHADNMEFEVYRGEIADEGEINLDFAANLMQSPKHDDGRGATVFQGTTELSYGLDDHWEIGLKLPVYALGGALHSEGLLTEIKYVAPHEKTGWYGGAEIEAGYETMPGENEQWTIEAVPIVGWRNALWDFTLNPGLTIASHGDQRGRLLFEPAAKLALQVADKSVVGVEYFSEAGPVGKMLPGGRRNELAFLTLDTKVGKSTINVGIGHGLNSASPGTAIKTLIDLEFD